MLAFDFSVFSVRNIPVVELWNFLEGFEVHYLVRLNFKVSICLLNKFSRSINSNGVGLILI